MSKPDGYHVIGILPNGKEKTIGKPLGSYQLMKEEVYKTREGFTTVNGLWDGTVIMTNPNPGAGLPAPPAPELTD